jgi:hypothetical protein
MTLFIHSFPHDSDQIDKDILKKFAVNCCTTLFEIGVVKPIEKAVSFQVI